MHSELIDPSVAVTAKSIIPVKYFQVRMNILFIWIENRFFHNPQNRYKYVKRMKQPFSKKQNKTKNITTMC